MPHATDPALPLERPLAESLTIYGKRLAILLAVALANAVLLVILWLNARSSIFSGGFTLIVVSLIEIWTILSRRAHRKLSESSYAVSSMVMKIALFFRGHKSWRDL